MGLETGTFISDLVPSNPLGTDSKSQGDDHIRLLKATILNTFPNVSGVVTPTHAQLNLLASTVNDRVLRVTGGAANMGQLTAGMFPNTVVPDAALSSNVPLKDASNTFAESVTISAAANRDLFVEHTAGAQVRVSAQSGTGLIGTVTNHQVEFRTNNTPRLTLSAAGAATFSGAVSVAGVAHLSSTASSATAPSLRVGDSGNTGLGTMIGVMRNNTAYAGFTNSATNVQFYTGAAAEGGRVAVQSNHQLRFDTNNSTRMTISNSGDISMDGALSVEGAVRAGLTTRSGGSTLVPGQVHSRGAGSTVQTGAAGQWVAVYNNSASPITLTQGSGLTLRLAGTGATGSRTLAGHGFAFLWWESSTEAVCGGTGVS